MITKTLKDGDILHCQGNRFLTRLIKLFTKSRISHTALLIELDGRLFVADSQKDGTNLRDFVEWQSKYKYKFFVSRYGCDLDPIERRARRERVYSTLGVMPYDYYSLLFHQPRYILTGKWSRRARRNAKNRFYCSEFVAHVLGFDEAYKLSPEDLLQRLKGEECYREFYPMGDIF